MKRLFMGLATIYFVFTVVVPTYAGEPFGFDINKDPNNYKFCKKSERRPHWWICKSAPRPHSAFETYLLQYVGEIGVCTIKGLGKIIRNDAYGTRTISAIDKLHDQLAKKYGEGKKRDLLRHGSIWNEPRDWIMGIRKRERIYAYTWFTKTDGFQPVGNVKQLTVVAKADRSGGGYAVVEFNLTTTNKCDKKIEEDESKSF